MSQLITRVLYLYSLASILSQTFVTRTIKLVRNVEIKETFQPMIDFSIIIHKYIGSSPKIRSMLFKGKIMP